MSTSVVDKHRRKRREDEPLLTGDATYTDDISTPEMAYAAIRRSWVGNATITGIDTSAALECEGVITVLTGTDLPPDDTGVIKVDREDQQLTPFPMLARDRVRYTGEAVAVVIADDRYVAHDAVDHIAIEYDHHDVITDPNDALESDAPLVHETLEDNRAFEHTFGDTAAVETAFEQASETVSLELHNQRLLPNAIEPRSVIAAYDSSTAELTVQMSTQTPHRTRNRLSKTLGVDSDRIRVIAPDVGGGFGSKGSSPYAGESITAWCAMALERPIKWIATRSESHQADRHGRDFHTIGELAVADDGTMTALRIDSTVNVGAYALWNPTGNVRNLLSNAYAIPAIAGRVTGVLTNTAPVAPYRGAGRPETVYVVERLVEEAAAVLGLDPVEIRRQNFIESDAFPFETALGVEYDSGDYETAMDRALELLEYDAARERQAQAREDGRHIGIGISSFVENTGSAPSLPETARVELCRDGRVVATCGTADHGQGHATTFAQIVSEKLGIPYDDVEIREGDTAALEHGVGTFGSRSAPVGASALIEGVELVREQARELTAEYFDTNVASITFEDGTFTVRDTPSQSIYIGNLLDEVGNDTDIEDESRLVGTATYDPPNYAFGFGTHIVVAEVVPDTGEVTLERYVAVDDCGVQFNPLLVDGQVHGGIVQGIGQALSEEAVYDENGTLLTGSLQDYAMPRAHQLPEFETDSTVTPCPHNPSGAKGIGEGGTIGAPPAVVNAVVDAVRPFGVTNIDMPLTDERVWRAIDEARGGER